MDQEPKDHHIIPVWFFVGVILLIYGMIILVAGVQEFSHPPATVLSSLHPAIWWGALLVGIGAVYTCTYWPRRS